MRIQWQRHSSHLCTQRHQTQPSLCVRPLSANWVLLTHTHTHTIVILTPLLLFIPQAGTCWEGGSCDWSVCGQPMVIGQLYCACWVCLYLCFWKEYFQERQLSHWWGKRQNINVVFCHIHNTATWLHWLLQWHNHKFTPSMLWLARSLLNKEGRAGTSGVRTW